MNFINQYEMNPFIIRRTFTSVASSYNTCFTNTLQAVAYLKAAWIYRSAGDRVADSLSANDGINNIQIYSQTAGAVIVTNLLNQHIVLPKDWSLNVYITAAGAADGLWIAVVYGFYIPFIRSKTTTTITTDPKIIPYEIQVQKNT